MILQSHSWAYIQKRYMHLSVHSSTIYSSQNMEATQMSIDRWVDKEAVVHIFNAIVLSHKKEHIWICSNEVD